MLITEQYTLFLQDIAIVRFESAGLQDDDLYNQLFRYLNNRDRCGVVSGSSGPTVKDMYIVPVASHAGLPSILLPSDGPGKKQWLHGDTVLVHKVAGQ